MPRSAGLEWLSIVAADPHGCIVNETSINHIRAQLTASVNSKDEFMKLACIAVLIALLAPCEVFTQSSAAVTSGGTSGHPAKAVLAGIVTKEPGSDPEIAQFCKQNYGVEFDMFSKIVVKGSGQDPLYKYLTAHPKFSGQVDWNFEKFLIGRNGDVIARFKSEVEPASKQMVSAIENALAAK